ncbi:hypothetical protein MMC15_006745 [Xylographa vitiligo]|nr:hypothetical protein [Xylographa vitiligo]
MASSRPVLANSDRACPKTSGQGGARQLTKANPEDGEQNPENLKIGTRATGFDRGPRTFTEKAKYLGEGQRAHPSHTLADRREAGLQRKGQKKNADARGSPASIAAVSAASKSRWTDADLRTAVREALALACSAQLELGPSGSMLASDLRGDLGRQMVDGKGGS